MRNRIYCFFFNYVYCDIYLRAYHYFFPTDEMKRDDAIAKANHFKREARIDSICREVIIKREDVERIFIV